MSVPCSRYFAASAAATVSNAGDALLSGKGAPQPVHARQAAAERGIEHELLHAHPGVGQPQMHHAALRAERDGMREAQRVEFALA